MKKKQLYILGLINLLTISPFFAQSSVKVVNFQTLENIIDNKTDTTYIINFFASWCKPCLKELPELIDFANTPHDNLVKFIFVSLDFKNDTQALEHIITQYHITQSVYLLDDPNANKWIDKIAPTWSGAIPATLITNTAQKQRTFIEGAVNHDTLEQLIK